MYRQPCTNEQVLCMYSTGVFTTSQQFHAYRFPALCQNACKSVQTNSGHNQAILLAAEKKYESESKQIVKLIQRLVGKLSC